MTFRDASPYDASYLPPRKVEDLDVVTTDETVGRACFLAGAIPGLPPIPPSLGAGADVPQRHVTPGRPVGRYGS